MPEAHDVGPFVLDHRVSDEREDLITSQLIAFNQAHTTAQLSGQHEPLPLHLYALDRTGTLRGGLVGRTHAIPYWCEISTIWVDEQVRHHGVGRWLMLGAEREAWQRGCRYARVATSNFQAPGFYDQLGYALYGRLENCPPGETVYYFWKEITAVAGVAALAPDAPTNDHG
ncbi:MAG TPA: GNAT family N-acetyltransferase [Ktedonobacterales bacterium]|jgi:ribosomal protein S18 acetylase RimI-like enzyme|nr:GNAT family N-acetyltransferase [Ktedonobacterales bacterium]